MNKRFRLLSQACSDARGVRIEGALIRFEDRPRLILVSPGARQVDGRLGREHRQARRSSRADGRGGRTERRHLEPIGVIEPL